MGSALNIAKKSQDRGSEGGFPVTPPGENGVMFDPVAELFVGVKEVAAERRDG